MSDQYDYSADVFHGPLTDEQHARLEMLTAEIARLRGTLTLGTRRELSRNERHEIERRIVSLEVELRALLAFG